MDNFDRWNLLHSLIMIIFIIVIVLAVILGVSAYTDMNISQTANLTSTFGTILLSALLAYLYFQMW